MNNEGYQITYTGEEVQELLDKAGTAVQTETDPTVPSWAKTEEKPTYTATEVGALPEDTELFSGSYNDLTDVPTIPDSLSDLSDDSTHRLVTDAEKTAWNGKSDFSGSYNDLTDKPTIPAAQVNADWNATSGVAKILNKPTIPAEQIQSDWNQSNTSAKDYIKNKPTIPVVPSNVSAFTNDAGYITTETDPTVPSWAKQSSKPSYAVGEINGAQETLVSGTNIKTINGNSVLGSGNISIQEGDANVIESITFNGGSVPVDSNKNAAITYTAPVTSVNGNTGAVVISVPTKVSDLTNDAGYITSYTETDPVFSASAAHSITSTDIATWNTRKAQSIPFGHVDSSSIATAFTANVEGITALEDGVCCYLNNTVITSAASTTTPKCWTLNINNLGAKPVYVTTAAATFSTTQFTLNYKFLFTYDSSLNNGEGGWYIGQLFNTNTTYSTITQAEIDAGTGTKARNITPKLLRDNFYTEDEVDSLLADKADSADLAAVATSGSYNDLDDKPTIPTVPTTLSSFTDDLGSSPTHTHSQYLTSAPVTSVNGQTGAVSLSIPTESTVSGWGFTKNAGTITGVTMNGASKGTSGVVDLGTVITAHQDISGKANIADLAAVATSGSYTDLDDKPTIPVVPSNLVTGSSQSYTVWSGTQAQYDALATKDNNTIYLIKES